MTFVGKSLPELAVKRDRLIPNPNVLVEHGYALSRRTFSRVISVMNTAYGDCDEATLPFDLRHMRWPITYKLSTGNPKEPVKKAFVKELTLALRSILLLRDDQSTDEIFSAIQVFEAAVSDGKTNTGYLAEKVFGKIEKELTQYRITQENDKPFDETLIESLKTLKPLRDSFLEVCDVWLRSESAQPFTPKVVAFIQKVKALQMRPANVSGWDDKFGDNFGFLSHELLLSTVAILLKLERFDTLAEFLRTKFVIPKTDTPTNPDTGRFQILYDYSEALKTEISG